MPPTIFLFFYRGEGEMARGRKNGFKRWVGVAIRLGVLLAVFLILGSWIQVAVCRYINPPVTVRVLWEQVIHRNDPIPYQRPLCIWRPLEKISPHLQRAVLAAEDQRFSDHYGFDLIEIEHAAKAFFKGRRSRGASTISMQTARTVFLLPVRSITRKALEAYYTVLIELLWSKRRILEIYLNTVDWGNGRMGAEAASMAYFKVRADALTPRQAALLAAVLPNPYRLSPEKPSPYVRMRADRILSDMRLMPSF